MSALTDRLRLSPKRTFVVFGFLASVGYWYMEPSPDDLYEASIKRLQTEMVALQKKVSDTEVRFNDKKKFQDEMEQVSQTFRLALDYLPKELAPQDLLSKISIEARSAGVNLDKFTPKDSVPKDFYDELPIEIGVRGTYGNMLTFLVSVSKLPRIITVRNVDIGAPNFVDGQATMQMTGILVGYRYKEVK